MTSLLSPSQRPSSTRNVLMAPILVAIGVAASTHSSAATLYGIVMLAPSILNASAKARKSSKSGAASGTYTASMPASRNAALCIAGESECSAFGLTTPKTRVAAPTGEACGPLASQDEACGPQA